MFSILFIWYAIDTLRICFHYYEQSVIGNEVYYVINKSKTKKKVKKLILGDSVGNQLYPCEKYNDVVVSLACNQAITLAGHFFLLINFIETNKDDLPDEVILLINPFSLKNDVDHLAYQYFLKPFPINEYSSYYTEHLRSRIYTIPLYWSAYIPVIRVSNYTPKWAVPQNNSPKSISPLSCEYLLKMDSLTRMYNISFRMVSTPVKDDRVDEMDCFWKELELSPDNKEQLKELLNAYKESVCFMPYSWFRDEVHFFSKNIPVDYLGILSE